MENLEKNNRKVVEKFDFSFFYLTFDDQSVTFYCIMHGEEGHSDAGINTD